MSKSGLPLVKAADAEGISTSAAAMVSLGAPRGKAKRSAVFLGRCAVQDHQRFISRLGRACGCAAVVANN